MVENRINQVEKIPVKEILRRERFLYMEDESKSKAIFELRHYLAEMGKDGGYRESGYVKLLRALDPDKISRDLSKYIKSRSFFKLKIDVHRAIFERDKDDYQSALLRSKWKKVRKGIFNFYYFSDIDYVNVFSITEEELPLYLNYNFSKEDTEIFLKRMKREQW